METPEVKAGLKVVEDILKLVDSTGVPLRNQTMEHLGQKLKHYWHN